MPEKASKILQGSLGAVILKLLAEQGRMYGYEMTRAVKERSEGRLVITEAALYPALHRLVDEGILETQTETFQGRERKYYCIARKGKAEAVQRIRSLSETLSALQKLLYESGINPA